MYKLLVPILGWFFLSLCPISAEAAVAPGHVCDTLGASQISEDRANILACLLVTGSASATTCAMGGGCVWKPMTPVYMDTFSNIGVGTVAPRAKVDVAGNLAATGSVQVGGDAAVCLPAGAGKIRYTGSQMEFCNGSAWVSFISGVQFYDISTLTWFGSGSDERYPYYYEGVAYKNRCPDGWVMMGTTGWYHTYTRPYFACVKLK